jgi:hypothetical protein
MGHVGEWQLQKKRNKKMLYEYLGVSAMAKMGCVMCVLEAEKLLRVCKGKEFNVNMTIGKQP